MKPIFAFDITEDKENGKNCSELFLVKKTNENLEKYLDENVEDLESTVSASKLPTPLVLIEYICGLFGLIVVSSMLTSEVGIRQAIRNAPILCVLGVCSLIIGAALLVASVIKSKRVLKEENAEGKIEKCDRVTKEIFAELEVPADAVDTDVLLFSYKLKDDEIKPVAPGLSPSPYLNHRMMAYVEDDILCLADVGGVYCFPIEKIRALKTVKKRVIIPEWHKEEKHNKGVYKEFKIATNQYGYTVKGYHVLEMERDGETYGLYFPAYERHTLERLTGIVAESLEE